MMRALMLVPLLGLAACTEYGGEPVRPGPGPSQWGTLSGQATYRERIALPPNAQMIVEIRDVSRADARAPVIASTTVQARGRQVPLAFSLRYNVRKLEPRSRYAVSARITDGGRLLWTTDTNYTFRPGQDQIMLNLVSAQANRPSNDRPGRPTPGRPSRPGRR
ncbi:MAG TPA: YbaY family lipoprotein [Sphingobium sp.]|nr:YbaY family lipoprotein [Sphingobium sp.]